MTQQRMMHVLPVEAYTSQAWFDREQEQIFSKVWRYAGLAEDITDQALAKTESLTLSFD